jgi:hypothetical protein
VQAIGSPDNLGKKKISCAGQKSKPLFLPSPASSLEASELISNRQDVIDQKDLICNKLASFNLGLIFFATLKMANCYLYYISL